MMVEIDAIIARICRFCRNNHLFMVLVYHTSCLAFGHFSLSHLPLRIFYAAKTRINHFEAETKIN